MSQINPGVTSWAEAWAQINRSMRLTDGLGIAADDDTQAEVIEQMVAALAAQSPLSQASGGDGLLMVRAGKSYRIDIGSAQFAAFIASLAALTGATVMPATKEQLWAGATGFFIVTPQVQAAAEEFQVGEAAVVSGGFLSCDGSKFFRARATLTTNVDFSSPVNLSPRPRTVRLTASGGTRTVLASGFDLNFGIGAGVAIPADKFADFEVSASTDGALIRHLGTTA